MSYEQHISVMICNTTLAVIRRPVSLEPVDGAVGLIDYGTSERIERQRVGIFKGGEWRTQGGAALREQPTHWTSMFEDKIDVPA